MRVHRYRLSPELPILPVVSLFQAVFRFISCWLRAIVRMIFFVHDEFWVHIYPP